jgi:hypothetical protein
MKGSGQHEEHADQNRLNAQAGSPSTRSITIAIPCPTPIHIVQSA